MHVFHMFLGFQLESARVCVCVFVCLYIFEVKTEIVWFMRAKDILQK